MPSSSKRGTCSRQWAGLNFVEQQANPWTYKSLHKTTYQLFDLGSAHPNQSLLGHSHSYLQLFSHFVKYHWCGGAAIQRRQPAIKDSHGRRHFLHPRGAVPTRTFLMHVSSLSIPLTNGHATTYSCHHPNCDRDQCLNLTWLSHACFQKKSREIVRLTDTQTHKHSSNMNQRQQFFSFFLFIFWWFSDLLPQVPPDQGGYIGGGAFGKVRPCSFWFWRRSQTEKRKWGELELGFWFKYLFLYCELVSLGFLPSAPPGECVKSTLGWPVNLKMNQTLTTT